MKTIFKKAISILLVVGIMAACMVGCNNSVSNGTASSTSSKAASSTVSEESGFHKEGLPIVDEVTTLDVLTTRWSSMGDSFTQNQWLIDLEANTNVKIEWQVQSLNDWAEQRNILLASGELPSVILGSQTFGDTDILNNVEMFLDLTDIISEYMPNLSAAMEETPALRNVVTFTDGNIYSLPRKLPCRPKACNQPIINKTWLDNLALPVPTTIDELYTVLKAFIDQDANGNGDPNDEFAYSGAGDIATDLLNPFGITDLNGTHMMIQDDGSLVYFPVSENYKEGLNWLHKLYEDGIIDDETFTQDSTMQDGKRKNESVSLVGFDYAWTPDSLFGQWSDEYIALAPIAGSDGKKYASGDEDGISSIVRNEAEITTFCEHPEIAARWLDEFYNGEASIQNFWGAIGTVITKNSNGTYTLNDPPEGTSADSWYWDQSLRDFGPKYVSPDFEEKIVLPSTGDGLKLTLSKMAEEHLTTPYPVVMYTSEESDKMATLLTDINTYIETTRADWITNGGIDEGWDAYVKKLNDMGLEDLIKIYSDAYDRYLESSK